ncbi:hypothetical protein A2630_03370 [Candidatus Woesebacteria bacterium RIFCSPHIGHO2_01_FULL_44_10]|uniref:Nudix hydrolase domain-containing protein n=1 Tax=Candidatus Woesebacteria bacterium RIFCSPLOWO2_01_FULL_44_14 TaxID=1802525 RepID=A0A1F8BXT1_9BACT|nr:MAG: hypothetical protein A2630_03370 [Candidatus Woesebacteria bacterium RIFCSPHIGHO2_01_FULL_44_10]OGM56450.1 MAG: hypothetical protein A3F62_02030 [Candidatus Woesebacteria bacterium RIFCSPHIGHO2_12_FULL_44_11]OGM68852.1 MAG: hypothetical protein A2975_00575 [Candidatus Woesebacteria bacterium RIFCSPLOWO2_01_FULL_44_14]
MPKKGSLNYRKKVAAVVIDGKGNFLIVNLKTYSEKDWNFPGGGIDPGETEEEALLRELTEELGTNQFQIVKKSKQTLKYDFPDFMLARILKDRGETWKGQIIRFFLVMFTGEKDILPNENEIRRIKWVKYRQLKEHFLFPDQWQIAKKTIAEFGL